MTNSTLPTDRNTAGLATRFAVGWHRFYGGTVFFLGIFHNLICLTFLPAGFVHRISRQPCPQ